MPRAKKRIVAGTQAFFFPDAAAFTVPGAGTASRTALPGPADPAWFDCGVSDWKFKPENKYEDLKGPSPGARVLIDVVTTERGLTMKGTLKEMTNLVWQMILGTAALPLNPTVGGAYVPLAGDGIIRGWFKFLQYDQDNILINTGYKFVAMTVPGDLNLGDKPIDIDVDAKLLYSALNAGTLT